MIIIRISLRRILYILFCDMDQLDLSAQWIENYCKQNFEQKFCENFRYFSLELIDFWFIRRLFLQQTDESILLKKTL